MCVVKGGVAAEVVHVHIGLFGQYQRTNPASNFVLSFSRSREKSKTIRAKIPNLNPACEHHRFNDVTRADLTATSND